MKKKELLLLLFALLLALLVFFASRLPGSGKEAAGLVRIQVNGEFYAQEALTDGKTIEILQENGEKNVISLSSDGFRMAYSTCTNQLCIQQGPVTLDNYARRALGTHVLCLPNGVDVELVLLDRTPDPELPDI